MRFIKLFYPAFFYLVALQPISAQLSPKEKVREQIQAARVGYISLELNLTTAEAEKFWPLYNEYTQKRENLDEEPEKDKRFKELSDAELTVFIEQKLANEEKIIALKKQLYKDLQKIIPIRKIAKLQHAENHFRKKLLERAAERREDRPPFRPE